MIITKQFLKDEALDFKKARQEKYESSSGKSLSEYLRQIDAEMNNIEDFVQFIIDRNFKHQLYEPRNKNRLHPSFV